MQKSRPFHLRRRPSGFTLLEVIVALAILAVAVLGFHQGQSSVVRVTLRSESMAQAVALAQMQMTETELALKNKPFQNFLEDEKGEFKDEKLKTFTWRRQFTKVDISCFIPQQETQPEGQGGILAIAQKVFEQSVRKIKITVVWKEGEKAREASLTQLYVRFEDLPKI